MKLVKTIAALGAVALLAPAAGLAQQRAQAPQGLRQNPLLTEQQREQLRTFDEQHRTAAETTRRELSELHRQLQEELTAAQPNTSRIGQLRNSIVQKESALSQQRLDRMAKLSSLLTAEQRQALRGRGLGSILRGGPGAVRADSFARGGRGGMRAETFGRRGPGVMPAPMGPPRQMAPRGDRGPRGQMLERRRGLGAGNDDLRAEIRRLEAQLEALRRRIR